MENKSNFIEFFKNTNKDSIGQTLSKTPEIFFDRVGFPNHKFLIGNTYEETRLRIYDYVYGSGYCQVCSNKVNKLIPGWERGWYKTCSISCTKVFRSEKMKGDKNSFKKVDASRIETIREKQSESMKKTIFEGKFTPKSCNYKNQRPILYKLNGNERIARSLWELMFQIEHPELSYEKLRIKYFDTEKSMNRIYIPDFHDEENSTVIEIRPKAYKHLLKDKELGVIESGYKYKIIDENYFYDKGIKYLENMEKILYELLDEKTLNLILKRINNLKRNIKRYENKVNNTNRI